MPITRIYFPLFLAAVLGSSTLSSQVPDSDSAAVLIRLLQRGPTDSVRFEANQAFDKMVRKYLDSDSSMANEWAFAPNVSVVIPGDKKFRLITWAVPSYSGDQYRYYGYLQIKEHKTGSLRTFTLADSTSSIRKPESERLRPDRWLGSTYYEVIHVKKKGKNFYTLLGWKGKDRLVTQKVIDILLLDNDQPKFGQAIFKTGKVFKSRVIFSYSSQATMSLRYDQSRKRIVFDHIGVPAGEVTDASVAGPDGSYDALKFKSGRWLLQTDVKVRQK